jgi:hypothetical protein
MKTAPMTMMMAGPRTVVWLCFSPVQRLDEWSEARVERKERLLVTTVIPVENEYTHHETTPVPQIGRVVLSFKAVGVF